MNSNNTKTNQWFINNVMPANGTGVLYGDCDSTNTLFAYRIATCLSCNQLDLSGDTEMSKKVLYMGSKKNISTFNLLLGGEEHKRSIKTNLSFFATDELVRQYRHDPISNLIIGMTNFMQFSGNIQYAPLIIVDLSDQAFGDTSCIKQATKITIGANFIQKTTGSKVLLVTNRNQEGFSSMLEYSDYAIKSMTLDEPECLGIRITHMNSFLVMPPVLISEISTPWGL